MKRELQNNFENWYSNKKKTMYRAVNFEFKLTEKPQLN